jgi:hypothetical protein
MTSHTRIELPQIDTDGHTECTRCGRDYHVDSSPALDLCWQCDEDQTEPEEDQRYRLGLIVDVFAVLDRHGFTRTDDHGQLVSAVTHYWADLGSTLARLAALVGKDEFYRFGTPRPGRDDNSTLGTGAYALDQAWHWLCLAVAAALTAVTATGGA